MRAGMILFIGLSRSSVSEHGSEQGQNGHWVKVRGITNGSAMVFTFENWQILHISSMPHSILALALAFGLSYDTRRWIVLYVHGP